MIVIFGIYKLLAIGQNLNLNLFISDYVCDIIWWFLRYEIMLM